MYLIKDLLHVELLDDFNIGQKGKNLCRNFHYAVMRCQFDDCENYETCRELLSGKFCLVKVLQIS